MGSDIDPSPERFALTVSSNAVFAFKNRVSAFQVPTPLNRAESRPVLCIVCREEGVVRAGPHTKYVSDGCRPLDAGGRPRTRVPYLGIHPQCLEQLVAQPERNRP